MKKRTIVYFLLIISAVLISSCAAPDIPQGYALIYAVEDYAGTKNDLSYTVDDAEAVAELLGSKGWEVELRKDTAADLPGLTADVEALKLTMQEDDRFLFYFSGHGEYLELSEGAEPDSADDYEEIIILSGALTTIIDFMGGNSSADVLGVTVSDDSLAALLSELPTNNKTVIIDACFSGGFIGDGFTFNNISSDYKLYESSTTFAPIESMKLYAGYTSLNSDLPQNDFSVLTASGADEESFETSSLGHGVFTYFLLQTPAEADYNFDGYISLIEAWKFISGSIDSYWNSSQYVEEKNQYMANIAAFPVDPILFEAD